MAYAGKATGLAMGEYCGLMLAGETGLAVKVPWWDEAAWGGVEIFARLVLERFVEREAVRVCFGAWDGASVVYSGLVAAGG